MPVPRSASRPEVSNTAANTMLYADRTHDTFVAELWNSLANVSRATLTIVVSIAVIDAPITVTASTLAPRDIPRTWPAGERRVNDIAGTVVPGPCRHRLVFCSGEHPI